MKMPKLSKTRIINLNYNDNKRTIYDEIFDYGNGENTLFSMDNGIGKTVLIQVFMQPFMNTKRTLAGRKFDEYFTDRGATYIMHEVLLDNLEKLLIGMVIKKEFDDESNKLRILAFTHKYSKPSDYDIVRIPFVVDRKILTFKDAEKVIKDYSRGRSYFKYFNFNDSSKRREYFNYLGQHRIDRKEWETIIRDINNDESGLSNLYDKYKTDESLVKQAIIPLIESKLKDETSKINILKTNLTHYINSYIQNKDSIKQLSIYKDFSEGLKPVIDDLTVGKDKLENKDQLFNQLSLINSATNEELIEQSEARDEIVALNARLENEKNYIKYEKHSLDYHKCHDEELLKEDEKQTLVNENDQQQKLLDDSNRHQHTLLAAEQYQELIRVENELTTIQERIRNYTKSDSDIGIQISNYKYNLNRLYKDELNKYNFTLSSKQEAEKQIKINVDQTNRKRLGNRDKTQDLIKVTSKLENRIDDFKAFNQQFKQNYTDFGYSMNLYEEYDEADLSFYQQRIVNEINKTESDLKDSESTKEKRVTKISELNDSIARFKEQIQKHKDAKKDKKNELESFNNLTNPIKEILRIKGFKDDVFEHKNHLIDHIKSELIKLNERLKATELLIKQTSDEKHKYQTGLIQLPQDIKDVFEEKGIHYQYCLSWLQKYQGPKGELETLIDYNPLFPYGILLNEQDIKILKSESIDVFTSIPIPIFSLSQLDLKVNYEKNQDLIKIENQLFLVSFNELLIDEEEREKLLFELDIELKKLQSEAHQIEERIKEDGKYLYRVEEYPYKGNEGEQTTSEINEITTNIEQYQDQFNQATKRYQQVEKEITNLTQRIKNLEENMQQLINKREYFDNFIDLHNTYIRNKQELDERNKELIKLKKEYDQLENSINDLNRQLNECHSSIKDIKREISQITIEVEKYQDFTQGEELHENIHILRSRLDACEDKLDKDISRDSKDEARCINEKNKISTLLNREIKDGNLTDESYKTILFTEDQLDEVYQKIKEKEKLINNNKELIQAIKVKIAKLQADKDYKLNQINDLGFNEPLEKRFIKDVNFKGRIEEITTNIKTNKRNIENYNKNIQKLNKVQYSLNEFNGQYTNKLDNFKFSFDDLDQVIIDINQLKDEYINLVKEVNIIEIKVKRNIDELYRKYMDDRLLNKRLEDYSYKEDKIGNAHEITSLQDIIVRRIGSMEIEMQQIKSEEETIINDIMRYCSDVLRELKSIDRNSIIKHLNKSQKLLNIEIPETVEEESLKLFIKSKVEVFSNLDDFTNELDSTISTAELLSKYIGNLNRVKVYIKKIEKHGVVKKTWKDTLSQNSGGEKFVSMFILLSSFMSYMRRSEIDLGNKEDKKIIIMDNPFAKTNAEHLLEPMFQIAEKYNIQLICFSGIGGSSVYNRFNTIYAAKVIPDRYLNKERIEFKTTVEMSDFSFTQESLFDN